MTGGLNSRHLVLEAEVHFPCELSPRVADGGHLAACVCGLLCTSLSLGMRQCKVSGIFSCLGTNAIVCTPRRDLRLSLSTNTWEEGASS